jgi:methylated-DNA-protein-cysteine methyltransferase-like protein
MMDSLCLRQNIILHVAIVVAMGASIVPMIIKTFPSLAARNYYNNEKLKTNLMPKRKSKSTKLKPINPSGKRDESFFEQVYNVVRQIPKGKVTSYGAIANLLGTKLSARMVGWAMNGAHRIKPKVPAHRVVNRNGMLTGKIHFDTPTRMQELLEKEGVKIKNDTILNFKEHFWDPANDINL